MAYLSENYHLRKCFLQRDDVPTQSMMMKKMSPPLADVCFKTMTPQLRVIAGLEPPLKGGGKDWIMSPVELLNGRAVLKPIKKEHITKWHWNGIDEIGMKLVQDHRTRMLAEQERVLQEQNNNWQTKLKVANVEEWTKCSREAQEANTKYLRDVVREFETLYIRSINKLQDLLFDTAVDKIKTSRQEAFKKMPERYEDFLKKQATMLYERYDKKLIRKKAKLKKQFLYDLEVSRSALRHKLHDISVEKHVAVEKVRHFLECQRLACQIYVAMKERQECSKEMELTKHEHYKKKKSLAENITYVDFTILLAEEKDQKRHEFETFWKKKVCHVVKHFQMFVSYCLNLLPEHAEFFINMEKLMLLQLSEALEDPHVDSIIVIDVEETIVIDVETTQTPVARPHPFYLICDKGFKPKVNQDICPKHCTSSASQMPVIIINKQCIYSACDNFDQFPDKIKDYIHGTLPKDAALEDYHDYSLDVPVRYTRQQQLRELQLESSLLQVLQQEVANVRQLPIVCPGCQIPCCFYCSRSPSRSILDNQEAFDSAKENIKTPSLPSMYPSKKNLSKQAELRHQREPKWENYAEHAKSKKCDCSKLAKKHLQDHLPKYMTKMSKYEEPELLNYERCSLHSLKALVTKARGRVTPTPQSEQSLVREVATQYSDNDFEYLCTCFSEDSLLKVLTEPNNWSELSNKSSTDNQFRIVGGSMTSTHLSRDARSFATDRAKSLKRMVDASTEVKEIFSRKHCFYH